MMSLALAYSENQLPVTHVTADLLLLTTPALKSSYELWVDTNW